MHYGLESFSCVRSVTSHPNTAEFPLTFYSVEFLLIFFFYLFYTLWLFYHNMILRFSSSAVEPSESKGRESPMIISACFVKQHWEVSEFGTRLCVSNFCKKTKKQKQQLYQFIHCAMACSKLWPSLTRIWNTAGSDPYSWPVPKHGAVLYQGHSMACGDEMRPFLRQRITVFGAVMSSDSHVIYIYIYIYTYTYTYIYTCIV